MKKLMTLALCALFAFGMVVGCTKTDESKTGDPDATEGAADAAKDKVDDAADAAKDAVDAAKDAAKE